MKSVKLAVFAAVAWVAACQGATKHPLKVFILAGQSNMEGPAAISTIDYIADDPVTAPLYKEMVGPDGKPVVCDHVWLSYLTGGKSGNFEVTGKMTAGYGAIKNPPTPGDRIGPEFTFGITMSKAVKEPFLIIKTAWGGKSLHTDFRPPGAGSNGAPAGVYYRYMIEHVKGVLKDIKRVCPEYEGQGYEIAGFAWLQGWNDMVDSGAYPNRDKPGGYDLYSELLAQFIRDVRKDLEAPHMGFVIGVMGVGGPTALYSSPRYKDVHQRFRDAMAAPATLPEFKGNVAVVLTEKFWDEKLRVIEEKRAKVGAKRSDLNKQVKDGKVTKEEADKQVKEFEEELITPAEKAAWTRGTSNAGFHYLGCAKIFAQMGKAFAESLIRLEGP